MKLGSLRQTIRERDGGEGGTMQFKDGVGGKKMDWCIKKRYTTKETKLRRMNVVGENWKKVRMKDK